MDSQLHNSNKQSSRHGRIPPKHSSTVLARRMRARKACEPCRERKRRCDGNHPCGPCVRFEYECHYVSVRNRKGDNVDFQHPLAPASEVSSAPTTSENPEVVKVPDHQLQSLEANSGAAFVRKLALALDPTNAPKLHLFAWNLFLGARRQLGYRARVRPIVDIIPYVTMNSLASIYLSKVDPCYGFLDRGVLQQHLKTRWNSLSIEDPYDAVLCGIAALGFLFSRVQVESAEMDAIETARYILEQSTDSRPSIDIVAGWVLRVAYLRMTASPHIAWMASCTMMHTIEASGIHSVQTSATIPVIPALEVTPELRRRVLGVARHLNIWISFDLARSRVVLPRAESAMPSVRPGDYTTEVLSLLPLSERLDPEKDSNILDLRTALLDVLTQNHTEPPSVLAQCNLALLLLRRLRALELNISGSLLDDVLGLTSRAIRCAQCMLDLGSPWHHVANVPFQIVYILLAIDTPSSIAQLADAVKTLSNLAQIYDTEAGKEALNTACLLIHLHQKRKGSDAKSLADILRIYSPFSFVGTRFEEGSHENVPKWDGLNNPSWLDELMTDLPNVSDFDIDQLLVDHDQQNFSTEWP